MGTGRVETGEEREREEELRCRYEGCWMRDDRGMRDVGRASWVAASKRRKRERSGMSPMRQNATKAPGAPTPGTRKSAWIICPGGLQSAPGVAGLGTS